MSSELERYAEAAKDAGCPRDQYENFVKAGIILQPKQLKFSALARLADQPDGPTEIAMGGSRSAAKSFGLLAQLVADDCTRFPGLKCLSLRKIGKAGREAISDLCQSVLKGVPHVYNRNEGILTLPDNGSRVILGNFKDEKDIDQYLGLEYDVVQIEEATQLSFTKVNRILSCCRTSKPNWRARAYLAANPGGPGHSWFKKKYVDPSRRCDETETRFIQVYPEDNKFIKPEYLKYLDSLTGYLRKAWRDGDWDVAAGQFFTTFRYDAHTCKPFPIPADWRVWMGFDFGYTHYTVAYLMAQDGDGNVYVVSEHGQQRWPPARHATAIKEMLGRQKVGLDRLQRICAGHDAFRRMQDGGTIAGDYRKAGIIMRKANIDRINGAAEFLRRLGDVDPPPGHPEIKPTIQIFRSCPHLIETLPNLQHDPTNAEDVKKVDVTDDGDGGDDWYDAARYGLMHVAPRRKLEFVRIS